MAERHGCLSMKMHAILCKLNTVVAIIYTSP